MWTRWMLWNTWSFPTSTTSRLKGSFSGLDWNLPLISLSRQIDLMWLFHGDDQYSLLPLAFPCAHKAMSEVMLLLDKSRNNKISTKYQKTPFQVLFFLIQFYLQRNVVNPVSITSACIRNFRILAWSWMRRKWPPLPASTESGGTFYFPWQWGRTSVLYCTRKLKLSGWGIWKNIFTMC